LPKTREEMIDVRRAALLAGRHPETVRRWVWSGRLAARRQGNRLLVARGDVEALAGAGRAVSGLAEWAARAQAARPGRADRRVRSAAELVLEDRRQRSRTRAGR
jgi:hypothetical protein